MYVYIKQKEERCYTVGFYKPDGKWEPENDYDTLQEAAERVHYLNGGNDQAPVPVPKTSWQIDDDTPF